MHISRDGKAYYLRCSLTKSGIKKYIFSTTNSKDCITAIPDGYEIYEPPNGNIFLRRIIKEPLAQEEMLIIHDIMAKHCKGAQYILDVKKNGMGIYVDEKYGNSKNSLELAYLSINVSGYRKIIYDPCFRISKDDSNNEYIIERFCFLGKVNDWMYIEKGKNLKKLCEKYIPHIGKESFFEIM